MQLIGIKMPSAGLQVPGQHAPENKVRELHADEVAQLVLDQFDKLPKTGKPVTRRNGLREWTVLAGVVIEQDGDGHCVALATGVKALPDRLMPKCEGNVLHDMHAEVLALRAFNRFAIEQCRIVATGGSSRMIEASDPGRFRFKRTVRLSMYVSEVPCGDASMPAMAQADPWTQQVVPVATELVRGREHWDVVGRVRTKPGRKDSPVTLSKSCSDKLVIKQFTSAICGVAENLLDPVYISRLVLPADQAVPQDIQRAFQGRLEIDKCSDFHPFACETTNVAFSHSRQVVQSMGREEADPSPCSIVWALGLRPESVVDGVKSGVKPFKGKGQSFVCRRQLAVSVASILQSSSPPADYESYKRHTRRLRAKQNAYDSIRSHWTPTSPDNFAFSV